MKEGRDAGETNEQLADRISTALGDESTTRGERIARTETTGALNAGGDASRAELVEMGLARGKVWACIEDVTEKREVGPATR